MAQFDPTFLNSGVGVLEMTPEALLLTQFDFKPDMD